jgi:RNA polymerase sigma-70 factor (sigma-E family)
VDSATVAEMYRRHVPAARGFTYLLVAGDHALAEDLVHDAFIRAAAKYPSLRDPSAFDAYLRRAIVNALTSWRRRQAVERRWLQAQPPPATQQDGSQHTEAEMEVLRRLRSLPPRQRVAVTARVCLDLSEAQTAELLGCSVGTVKSLTSRGLAALRDRENLELKS